MYRVLEVGEGYQSAEATRVNPRVVRMVIHSALMFCIVIINKLLTGSLVFK